MKPRILGPWFIAMLFAVLVFLPSSAHAGMTPAEVKAFNDIKAKAENGDASAQSLLGYYYNNGLGVAKNNVHAVNWFRKAAAQGDAYAQFILGVRYAIGDGVPKDEIEAYAYLIIAGTTNADARKYLPTLKRQMSSGKIATGQKRAKELQKEIEATLAAKKAEDEKKASK
jgi:TPR repeat protein